MTTALVICAPSTAARELVILSFGPSKARSAVTPVSFGHPGAYSRVPSVTRPVILNSPLVPSRNGKSSRSPRRRKRVSPRVPDWIRVLTHSVTSSSTGGTYL